MNRTQRIVVRRDLHPEPAPPQGPDANFPTFPPVGRWLRACAGCSRTLLFVHTPPWWYSRKNPLRDVHRLAACRTGRRMHPTPFTCVEQGTSSAVQTSCPGAPALRVEAGVEPVCPPRRRVRHGVPTGSETPRSSSAPHYGGLSRRLPARCPLRGLHVQSCAACPDGTRTRGLPVLPGRTPNCATGRRRLHHFRLCLPVADPGGGWQSPSRFHLRFYHPVSPGVTIYAPVSVLPSLRLSRPGSVRRARPGFQLFGVLGVGTPRLRGLPSVRP